MKKLLLTLLIGAGFFTVNAQYTKLLDFAGTSNGSYPGVDLISDGTFLYGMTYQGGTNDQGTIFKIMPDGTGYAKLLDFAEISSGSYPYGSLISDGTFLYGMTIFGGANGMGTIVKVKHDGTGYEKLLDFAGTTNGSYPWGSLISDGTFLYGMTNSGGTSGYGTIFKIMPDGTGYVKLLDFTGTNGREPRGSLFSDGTFLYGVTFYGGTSDMGTIFKIMTDGTGYTKLLDFTGATNGSHPLSTFISDGTFLYGMTFQGGTSNVGTIFKIMPDGTGYIKLHDFAWNADGNQPQGSLLLNGTILYGMTAQGGTSGKGTIFKILTDGTGYTKLFDFNGTSDGNQPGGSLISDGTFLYGTTGSGGTNNLGTIFKYQDNTGTNVSQYSGNNTKISVHPNPANNILNVSWDMKVQFNVISIIDITGRIIKEEGISTGNSLQIDISKIPAGIYFIEINSGNNKFYNKIIKE